MRALLSALCLTLALSGCTCGEGGTSDGGGGGGSATGGGSAGGGGGTATGGGVGTGGGSAGGTGGGSGGGAATGGGTGGGGGEPDAGPNHCGGSTVTLCRGVTRQLGTRPYCLYVPSSYVPGTPMPLVLLLHGYGATGQTQASYFGIDDYAEARGFLVAKPDGTLNGLGQRYWNAFDACCAFNAPGAPDDVAYLTSVIDDVASAYSVDSARVYAMGHSNGGFMSHRLACDRTSRFKAIVSLAGVVDPSVCHPSGPISIAQVHGDADQVIHFDGGQLTATSAPYISATATVDFWQQANGCSGPRRATGSFDLICDTGANAVAGDETTVWAASCDGGVRVELWQMDGGSHVPTFIEPEWPRRALDFLLSQ